MLIGVVVREDKGVDMRSGVNVREDPGVHVLLTSS